MKRFKLLIVLFFIGHGMVIGQYKYERQYRIRKVQFPEKALDFVKNNLEDARKIRFYKEIDSAKISFETKFKKDRLKYSIAFDETGNLEHVKIRIKEIDIPNDSYRRITAFMKKEFSKYRIRRMRQQYPLEDNDIEKTLKTAFQNLLLPSINYELVVSGKKTKSFEQYEVLFSADGSLIKIRKSLPPNYDHVLY